MCHLNERQQTQGLWEEEGGQDKEAGERERGPADRRRQRYQGETEHYVIQTFFCHTPRRAELPQAEITLGPLHWKPSLNHWATKEVPMPHRLLCTHTHTHTCAHAYIDLREKGRLTKEGGFGAFEVISFPHPNYRYKWE